MSPAVETAAPGLACPACGFRNRTVARFCRDCGEALAGALPATSRRRLPAALAAASALSVAAAGAWLWSANLTGRPKAAPLEGPARKPSTGPFEARPSPAPASLPGLTDQDFADEMAKQGDLVVRNAGAEFAFVPGGWFTMGSDRGNRNERPARKVELGPFLIAIRETTVAEYARCVEAGACSPAAGRGSCNWGRPGMEHHPVNCVTWEDASRYCRWSGRRLPTEAEWERAARGTDERTYPWGEDSPSATRLNAEGAADGFSGTAPTGSFPSAKSPIGALDMAGNVAEWTEDRFDADYYRSAPERDPKGPDSGELRAVRGGSWYRPGEEARTTARAGHEPGAAQDLVGVRCAASPRALDQDDAPEAVPARR